MIFNVERISHVPIGYTHSIFNKAYLMFRRSPGHHVDGGALSRAELLLQRMLVKIEGLCDERDRLKKEQGGPTARRVLGGRS